MISLPVPTGMLLLAVASLGCEATPAGGSSQKTTAAPTASAVPMTTEARTAPKPTATAASSATPSAKRLLEVALVDDELDPFAPADGQKIPEGLTVEQENAPQGPGKTVVRHYLRVPRGDVRDVQAALAPHKAWWTSVEKKLPAGRRFAFQRLYEGSGRGDRHQVGWRSFVVHTDVVADETAVAKATAEEGAPEKRWGVTVTLTSAAGERFHELTKANVKRRMAILVHGEVTSAPVIQEAIAGGALRITLGPLSAKEQQQKAKSLAAALAPSMP